jgi:D-alanine-D-alanine ligase
MVEDWANRYENQAVKFDKVAVLMGGRSSEREVSLKTGEAVLAALRNRGYTAVGIDAIGSVWEKLADEQPDAVFLALHGRYGEDGTIQGLLELMDIPYTGSGVMASSVAMDKIMTKALFRQAGIPVADDYPADGPVGKFPVIVKPSREGSTIGVTVVDSEPKLKAAVAEAHRYDDYVLVEEFVEGRLLTIAVVGADPKPMPIVEVIAGSGFYDYESKYTPGMTEYVCPAQLEVAITTELQQQAVAAHRCVECADISRVDFILEPSGRYVCLEVNTMPGLTETSLVPKSAAAAGIPFEDLVETILKGASLKQKPKG